jgi:methanogenic corrinoid protein MtbC1
LVAQEKTVKAVKEFHPSGKVKVMVSGTPMTRPFADRVDADDCGRDATAAVPLARQLFGDA